MSVNSPIQPRGGRPGGRRSPLLFALGFAMVGAALMASVLPLVPGLLAAVAASLKAPGTTIAVAVGLVIGMAAMAWAWWRNLILRAELRRLGEAYVWTTDLWLTDPSAPGREQPGSPGAGAAAVPAQATPRVIAELSHEFRTPLNGILGMAELMLDTALTPEQATYAQAVKTSGETLLSLVEELLDVSRLDAGKLPLAARPFSLAAMVEEVMELLAPRAQAKGLEIASYLDEQVSDSVVGDPTRLRQVLLNLAGNAVKFTERGGVTLTVEPGRRADEVAFAVRDTGIGIAAEDQARIFLDFEQGDGGTRTLAGSGLGLAISRRIVQRMGGSLALDSTPGAGSTFTVTVVLPAASEEQGRFQAPDLTRRAVLIVAHGAIEASLLSRRLRRWGAATRIAADAPSALTLLGEERWNAVIVDHRCEPEAVARLAAEREVEHRIVTITPAERQELPALMQAGFSAYLVNPVRAASLAARLGHEQPRARLDRIHQDARRPVSVPALSILIAEDNEINALLSRALAEKMGHRAKVVTDGKQAVEAWRAARASAMPFDLVLMDLHMPGLDGLQAAARIRAFEATAPGASTPILALTANVSDGDRQACLAAGMNGFLTKPIGREQLSEIIAGLTQRQAA